MRVAGVDGTKGEWVAIVLENGRLGKTSSCPKRSAVTRLPSGADYFLPQRTTTPLTAMFCTSPEITLVSVGAYVLAT